MFFFRCNFNLIFSLTDAFLRSPVPSSGSSSQLLLTCEERLTSGEKECPAFGTVPFKTLILQLNAFQKLLLNYKVVLSRIPGALY